MKVKSYAKHTAQLQKKIAYWNFGALKNLRTIAVRYFMMLFVANLLSSCLPVRVYAYFVNIFQMSDKNNNHLY